MRKNRLTQIIKNKNLISNLVRTTGFWNNIHLVRGGSISKYWSNNWKPLTLFMLSLYLNRRF